MERRRKITYDTKYGKITFYARIKVRKRKKKKGSENNDNNCL